ncbi:MAG: hypothetical protein COV29_01515 [Candidatus Yanofskybacteria bacterium CG10_big_fil_rev_8_21_14_0_10_36_16]|uniref:Uncharacterized protein n=1 Tax=Candidatus Yanofskybacteria bacterium CG10_big_fil_rev_8_21_14_0_10_36_16 TaxID=1975096 RepID=A0A2J0Q788_9BACT|nr:MAG: hypothetical protein COV29_01515 [Candidatus Yanofskybacteria bacterium CG10_big_fil_rev_8_21_14_0_10_36_16]
MKIESNVYKTLKNSIPIMIQESEGNFTLLSTMGNLVKNYLPDILNSFEVQFKVKIVSVEIMEEKDIEIGGTYNLLILIRHESQPDDSNMDYLVEKLNLDLEISELVSH